MKRSPALFIVEIYRPEDITKIMNLDEIAQCWPQAVAELTAEGSWVGKGLENPTITRIKEFRVTYESVDSYGSPTRVKVRTLEGARKVVVDHAGPEALHPDSHGVSNDGVVVWRGLEAKTEHSSYWHRVPKGIFALRLPDQPHPSPANSQP